MRPGGRLAAAIEVLDDIEKRKRPAGEALKDWGLSHRFAGSGDRAAIGNLVYDALRKKASLAWQMKAETPRALAIGVMTLEWGQTGEALNALLDGDRFAPELLSEAELSQVSNASLEDAPDWVKADIPEWLEESLRGNFDEDLVAEGQALAARPPVDLRVNTLKADRQKVLKALSRFSPKATPISPDGIRLSANPRDGRTPNVQADGAFQKGWFEMQDEASQLAAQLVYARPGEQVLDYCAGAGGKSLAIAAAMENKGQLYAYDADRGRLSAIWERLKRSGARNIQVREPEAGCLDSLLGRMDRVIVDAPCSGTGTWRRRPDTKWKLTQSALDGRLEEQQQALAEAREFVRPGGYLVYITCSILPEENEDQIYRFIENNPDFELLSVGEVWQDLYGFDKPQPWSSDMMTITMTPASTGTDGFFFSVLERRDN
ncbi:RsmB/NOP family class I SAM-dependent RNA methyltransferase [Coralliovum pocilloporae]|uniref:RsmB/NOP family class I SAM-dependent RNA methyltransferase n=1 Tax=Coralliovum pocilloporae TaxID=3066369 RepID=UPI003306DA09